MGTALFFREYFVWHYTEAFGEMWQLAKNLLRFGYHFFSLPLLVRTWISPWYQMRETHNRDLTDLESLGAAFFGNMLLRCIGFLLRSAVILIGLLFELSVCIGMSLLLVMWVFFPLFLLLVMYGVLRAL